MSIALYTAASTFILTSGAHGSQPTQTEPTRRRVTMSGNPLPPSRGLARNHTQRAKIIAGFSGVGKSYFANYCVPGYGPLSTYKFLDVSPQPFQNLSRLDNRSANRKSPNYPQNYIEHIRNLAASSNTVLLIDTDPAVRQALIDDGYRLTLVYPEVRQKPIYIKRYRDMKSGSAWMENFDKDWEDKISNLMQQTGCRHVVLRNAQNIDGVINNIVLNDVEETRQESQENNRINNVQQRDYPNHGVNIEITDTTQTITIPGQDPITIKTQRIHGPIPRFVKLLIFILLLIIIWLIFKLETERKAYAAANHLTRVRILDALEFWLEIERGTL